MLASGTSCGRQDHISYTSADGCQVKPMAMTISVWGGNIPAKVMALGRVLSFPWWQRQSHVRHVWQGSVPSKWQSAD